MKGEKIGEVRKGTFKKNSPGESLSLHGDKDREKIGEVRRRTSKKNSRGESFSVHGDRTESETKISGTEYCDPLFH